MNDEMNGSPEWYEAGTGSLAEAMAEQLRERFNPGVHARGRVPSGVRSGLMQYGRSRYSK